MVFLVIKQRIKFPLGEKDDLREYLKDKSATVSAKTKDGGIVIKDVNGDGYDDICIQSYYCYIWNPNESLYEIATSP